MNNKVGRSPNKIPRNTKYYDTLDLQPGHANPESSESDLVSGKMKKAAIIYYNSNTITIIYNICLTTSDVI